VSGVSTDRGAFSAPVVIDAAGAWASTLAGLVGLEVPVEPWRHDTAYFGLPEGRASAFPIVLDNANQVYFRPEGRELMLVGLETNSEVGGSPDRPERALPPDEISLMAARLTARVPWMTAGTFRAAHGGQDGITPDQRPILGPAGPDGFHLACGFSGTGFKTAPAIGAALAELILDGRSTTADLSAYALDRFAAGRLLAGRHPYGDLWR
jgi:sarcosine oxidase subunit beta